MPNHLASIVRNSVILFLGIAYPSLAMADDVILIATPKGALLSGDVIQQNGGTVLGALNPEITTKRFTVKASDAQRRIDELMATGEYIAVERDSKVLSPGFIVNEEVESLIIQQDNPDPDLPNDPLLGIQYHWLDRAFDTPTGMGFSEAWKLVEPKQTVTIAFVDGGFSQEGYTRDFTPVEAVSTMSLDNFTVAGVDYTSSPGDSGFSTLEESQCETSHGLGVAGIAVANTNNENQLAGIASTDYVQTVAVQATLCDIGNTSEMADGIRLAAGGAVQGIAPLSQKADIINVSLSSLDACSTHVQSAIDFARSQGSVVVVAAGNDNAPVENYSPANCEGVITVGAGTDYNTDVTDFSNYGEGVDIVARGATLLSLGRTSDTPIESEILGTQIWAGTSVSSPQISGVLAMAKTTSPSMDYDTMLTLLQDTATPMSGAKCDNVGCEHGLLNAKRFMQAVTGIENQTAGVISSNLSVELCDDTLYTMIDGVRARLCQSGTVTLTNFLAPEYTDVTVRFMASPAFEVLTINNGQVVHEGDEFSFPLSDLSKDNVEYGYQLCHSGACLETIYPVAFDAQSLATCG